MHNTTKLLIQAWYLEVLDSELLSTWVCASLLLAPGSMEKARGMVWDAFSH